MSFAVEAASLKINMSPVPPECRIAAGKVPSAGASELGCNFLDCGVWEHSVGQSCDVEKDEVFVVIQGNATVTKPDGSVLHLKPGTIGVLKAGEATTWNVTSSIRKVWITPKKPEAKRRVAIVTGCGNKGGIGFACAAALLREGYCVFVSSTTERIHERVLDLISETCCGDDCVKGAAFDLTAPRAPAALVSLAATVFGGIDVIVNNAGMTSVSQPSGIESGGLPGMSHEAWRLSMARNIETAVFVTQAALPHLEKSASGRIIVISSVTGPLMSAAHRIAAVYCNVRYNAVLGRCSRRLHMQLLKPVYVALFEPSRWTLAPQVRSHPAPTASAAEPHRLCC
jgi:NAD(P)-dependent dehydrogenase (short-subunit alcohol dehydrogenase family)/uncharacterized cupin superfamily protein